MVILGTSLGCGLLMVRRALRPIPVFDRLERYGLVSGRRRRSAWDWAVSEIQLRSRIAPADLEIVHSSASAIAAERLVCGLGAGALPLVVWLTTRLGAVDIADSALFFSVVPMSVIGFQFPVSRVRRRARFERRRFRTSLSAYLDLVSIMLAGGSGIESALHTAADIGDGPTFDSIAEALQLARTSRRSPWDTLGEVGTRFGIDELEELSATVRLGGEQGARMTASLVAKASALRSRELADVEARANESTERMGLPMVLLFLGFLVLLGYPAMHLITSGFGG